jgi:protein-S-isoprenylcysteine O-methyltransferase Ste14
MCEVTAVLPENYEESEAPRADSAQALFAAIFFAVWAADSFWLHWTTHYSQQVSSIIRTTLFILLTLLGGYLSWASHKQIFGVARQEAELVDYGVFRLSRHPMYLGIMMIYLGLTLSSMSVAALVVLAVIFLFYNYLASYEEAKLIENFGEKYYNYSKRVRRWL